MPVLDIKLSRIIQLLGQKISVDELEEILFRMGFEIESKEEKNGEIFLKIEITPDRPDMLSSYGFVRALKKYMLLSPGLDKYPLKYNPKYKIYVDKSVAEVRPYIAATVVKGVKISEDDLDDLIYAQEKLHETFCRGRKKASIGLYPLKKIKWPLRYYAEKPENIRFRPLGFDVIMDAREILEKHPKGIAYRHLLEKFDIYPVFVEGGGNVLSLPPIINSEDYGKVEVGEEEILIEVTGTHKPTVEIVINIMASIFAEMGGELYSVEIVYPTHKERSPYLEPKIWETTVDYINSVLGLNLQAEEIKKLLNKMGLDAEIHGTNLRVYVPGYRADIWHPIDIADDVGRAYGYDNFEPELTPVFTTGGTVEKTDIVDMIRELLIGLGYLEAFTFALTNKEDQYSKMLLDPQPSVEILGAKESKINIERTWLLPELLKTLSYNKETSFPVKLFEVSDVIKLNEASDVKAENETKLAMLIASASADYTQIRRELEFVLQSLGFNSIKFERTEHPSFIRGRVAKITVNNKGIGIIGELHPQVILNWGLSIPIAAAEISISKLYEWKYNPVEVAP